MASRHDEIMTKFQQHIPGNKEQCKLLNEQLNILMNDIQEASADGLSQEAIHTLLTQYIAVEARMRQLSCPQLG